MNQTGRPTSTSSVSAPESEPAMGVSTPGGHEIERAVLHTLQNYPSLQFKMLNVHQCGRDSICLEGYLESNEQEIDLCEVVRRIHGIPQVVNRVVTMHPPKKG